MVIIAASSYLSSALSQILDALWETEPKNITQEVKQKQLDKMNVEVVKFPLTKMEFMPEEQCKIIHI